MKKLISVFAALALVGSLAAQKGKKAPAKPAAPVVAAPKAPAMPAAVTAAPAMAGAAKGVGLFIEGFGSYTFANGSSQAYADGNGAAQLAADAVTMKTSAAGGFGGGGNIGYNIVENLGLVASFQYRSIKSREWSSTQLNSGLVQEQNNLGGQVLTGTTTATTQKKWENMIIGVGLRPSVNALGGTVYGGGGLAIVLPYTETATASFTTAAGLTSKVQVDDKWNLGLGAYGEVGYNYNITSNIYLGLGMKAIVVTVDNKDKTRVITNTSTAGVVTTDTFTYKESLSADNSANNTGTATDTQKQRGFKTNGVTDFSAYVLVGFRF